MGWLDAVQAVCAVLLVLVAVAYVVLRRRQAEDERELGRQTLREAVLLRLSSLTPTVTAGGCRGAFHVLAEGATTTPKPSDLQPPGTMAVAEFDQRTFLVRWGAEVRNHGPGPTTIVPGAATDGSVRVRDERRQVDLAEGETYTVAADLVVPGADLLAALATGRPMPLELRAEACAPLTGVVDAFTWTVDFTLGIGDVVYGSSPIFSTHEPRRRERRFPAD